MHIGPYEIRPALILAPMAGVADLPFRRLCRRLGAGLAVSEMTRADPRLRHTPKSRLRPEPARKHIRRYCREHPGAETFWRSVHEIDNASAQWVCVAAFPDAPLTLAA